MTEPLATAFSPGYPLWRRVFAYAIYPTVFCVCLGGAWYLMTQGVHPQVALVIFIGVSVAGVATGEWIQPHAQFWGESQKDVLTDMTHALLSEFLPPPIYDALVRTALLGVAAWLAVTFGMPSLWPTGSNIWVQLALAMILSEFGQYWWHRLCHENAWFWRFHATHHSAGRLYWLNAARFHPIDTVVAYALETLPLVLLGAPLEIIALFSLWTIVHGIFQHSNIELRLGPLNWIFSMAELHRWHHSRDTRHANKNYGANVIFWDVVFGTRHFPKTERHAPEDVGFEGMPNFPQRYLGQIASPFTWGKLKEEAAALESSQ